MLIEVVKLLWPLSAATLWTFSSTEGEVWSSPQRSFWVDTGFTVLLVSLVTQGHPGVIAVPALCALFLLLKLGFPEGAEPQSSRL